MTMYAIVKTGGKQYRVEQGQSLLVERLPASDGDSVDLVPLLVVDGSNVVDTAADLAGATVSARVVGHERGPKLRVVKFKPKRGYKRRTGHRQELTRIEVTAIKLAERRQAARRSPKPVAAGDDETGGSATSGASEQAAGVATEAPAKPGRSRRRPPASKPEPEEGNGA
jgi:large subunit ribosomal protein L21